MKRTAAQAGFPVDRQIIRVTVCVPADRCTRNEPSDHPIGMLQFRQYRCSEEDPHLQDQRNHKTTSAVAMLPITSERKALSVYRTHHIAGHVGCSTFSFGLLRTTGILTMCTTNRTGGDHTYGEHVQSHERTSAVQAPYLSLSFSLFSLCLLCML